MSLVFRSRAVASAALVLAVSRAAWGITDDYTGATAGTWNTATNWTNTSSGHTVPVAGDDAFLGANSVATSAVFNMSYSSALDSLTINASNVSTFTLTQSAAGTAMDATTENLGTITWGDFYVQSAGNNTFTTLNLGTTSNSSSQGCFSLSGTGVVTGTNENIGLSNGGNDGGNLFTQSGGSNTVTTLTIGGGTNGVGCYTISAGTLQVNGQIFLGESTGVGNTFTQNGSTACSTVTGGLIVGDSSGQAGTFNLSGGCFTVSGFEADFGYNGTATGTQSAGTLTFSGPTANFVLGTGIGGGAGNYTLSSSGTIALSAKMEVGKNGNGIFTQTGGCITGASGDSLYVGENSGSAGVYNLSNSTGAGNLTVDNEIIGGAGNGTFTQNGGNNTVNVSMVVGQSNAVSSVGCYTINSGNLTLVAGNLTLGLAGAGNFTQTGGAVSLNSNSFLYLGAAGGIGCYTMNANTGVPSLTAGYEVIGCQTFGCFSQSAGNNTVNGNLYLGGSVGAVGNYTLSGGNLSAASQEFIGAEGVGCFTQTGGTNNSFFLQVGAGSGANGTYTLSGSGILGISNNETIGNSTVGVFNQSGGTHNAGCLTIGNGTGSNGTFNISGGNLTVSNSLAIGSSGGIGNFVQQGGNVTLTSGNITLGSGGSYGAYSLSGGSISAPILYVSNGGTATFLQSGGCATFGQLYITFGATGSGGYTVAGTNPQLTVNGPFVIGFNGTGAFSLAGGTVNINGPTQINGTQNTTSSVQINSGNFTSTGSVLVGVAGSGCITQYGGNVTIGGTFETGPNGGSTGCYTMEGGNLTAAYFNDGLAGTGTVNQIAGNVTVTIDFDVGGAGGTGTYLLSSGTLNLPNVIGLQEYGLVNSTGTFTQSGGAISGYFYNNGQYNFTGGTFSGTFENGANGVATFSSFVFTGSNFNNDGVVNLPVRGQIGTAAGQTFSNDGTINLNEGQIYSNGPIVNTGTITGVGSIGGAAGFTNNLEVIQGNGLLYFQVAGTNMNFGTFVLSSGHAFNLSTTLTNAGTFTLNGGIVATTGTLNNIAGGIVSGPGTIAVSFSNAGTVVNTGGTLNIQTAWTNSGVTELGGITANLTGSPITNSGTIQGFGSVASQVTNNGTLEAIGGTLVFSGFVSNSGSGIIAASLGNKILITSGLFGNGGNISLTGGIFDNNNLPLINTGEISGYGTLRTGGLTNDGNITFSGTDGSTTTVNGNVTNNSPETLNVKFNPVIFSGIVTNLAGATLKTTSTTVTFAAAFNNSGNYTSDPSTNIFQADVTSAGNMTGGSGDAYYFSGGNFTNSGNFTNLGTLQCSDPTTNTGTFTESGTQTWSNGDTFTNNGGTASFNSDTGNATSSPLSIIANSGQVNFGATQHLASLSIPNGNVSILSGTVKTNSLSFGGTTNAWTGKLDLTSGKLIVEATANHAATLVLLKNEVGFGRTNNAGVLSTALASNKTLVVSDNAVAGLSTFGGVPVDSGSILETVAYIGDFNLDGVVDIRDLQIVANDWQHSATDWSQGDFNADGIVDIRDLQALANDWQAGVGAGGGSGDMSFSQALALLPIFGGGTPTPEPLSIGVLGAGVVMMLGRRRK